MTIWGGDACEIAGTRSETVSGKRGVEGYTANVSLMGDTENLNSTVSEIWNTKYPFSGSPTLYTLWATSVQISYLPEEQMAATGGSFAYSKVKYDVSYEWDNKLDLAGSFRTTINPTVERLVLSANGMFWKVTHATTGRTSILPVLPDEAPATNVLGMSITREYTKLKTMPTWLLDYAGTINRTSWTDTWSQLTFNKHTLLFEPGSIDMSLEPTGSGGYLKTWNVSFTLHFRQPSWTTYYIAKYNGYAEMVNARGQTVPLYPEKDWAFS
jgi:hypothetical protein